MHVKIQHTFDRRYYASRHRKDRIFTFVIKLLVFLAILPLFAILWFLIYKGVAVLSPHFLFSTTPYPVPERTFFLMTSAEQTLAIGGIFNAMMGTFMMVLLACIISIPLGILIATYITSTGSKYIANSLLLCIDIMQGLPSIVIGIVVNIWVVESLGQFSGFAGGIALSCIMLPIVIKNTVEAIHMVPKSLRYAALALGASYSATMLRITLPTAFGGISVGIVLGVARIMGETAPLLFTAFGNFFTTYALWKPMESISLQVYKNALAPNTNLVENAWGAALCLVILTLVMIFCVKPWVEKWKIQF